MKSLFIFFILVISVFVLLANRADAITKIQKPTIDTVKVGNLYQCQQIINSFQIFLDTKTVDTIRRSKKTQTPLLELASQVLLVKCISANKVTAKIITTLKVQEITLDKKTQKVVLIIVCGQIIETVNLQIKGAFIDIIRDEKNTPKLEVIPCK